MPNVKLLTAYARQRLDPGLRCQLYALLQSIPAATPIQDLARALRPTNPAAVMAAILHLAFHGVVDLPLTCAPITLSTAVALRHRARPEEVA